MDTAGRFGASQDAVVQRFVRFIGSVVALVGVALLAFPSTGAAWTHQDPSLKVGDPYVWNGRVWWVEGTSSRSVRYVLYSRTLRSGRLRSTPLETSALPRPEGTNSEGYPFNSLSAAAAMSKDGRLVLQGTWGTDPNLTDPHQPSGDSARVGVLASFDRTSGRLVALQQPPVTAGDNPRQPSELLVGWPAVAYDRSVSGLAGQPSTAWQLFDPLTRTPFAGHGSRVAGSFVLGYSVVGRTGRSPSYEGESWANGQGYLRVASLATDRERYRLRATALRRAAGADSRSTVLVALMANGSLRVDVQRGRGHGLYPVSVDQRGRVRRVGGRLKRASAVSTVTGSGRTFMRVRSPRASCRGLWLTDVAGRRGRRLASPDGLRGRGYEVPLFWDGRYAVWRTIGTGRQEDREGVRVDAHLRHLALRTRGTPARESRCR